MPKLKNKMQYFEWTKVNQKLQKGPFWRVFENPKIGSKSVTRKDSSTLLKGQKNSEKIGQFWRVLEILTLAVKQCYQTGKFC